MKIFFLLSRRRSKILFNFVQDKMSRLEIFLTIIIVILMIIIFNMRYRKQTTFQHNKNQPLTVGSYAYVKEYRKQLIKNITKLLDELDIKFILGHGNLLEFMRDKPILHDDDIDIRFDKKDLKKWEEYCKNPDNKNKYNLVFDDRFDKMDKQLYNGIQIRLENFENKKELEIFPEMDIHADLVLASIDTNRPGECRWILYDIDFEKRREIKYLGEKSYVPSEEDSHKVLKKDYGDNMFWSYRYPNRDVQIGW